MAKFFVGDNANNTYLGFDGANTNVTGARFISVYTAGENIAADKVVCVAGTEEDISITDDAYINDNAPNTNYGTEEYLYLGSDGASNDCQFYIKILFLKLKMIN